MSVHKMMSYLCGHLILERHFVTSGTICWYSVCCRSYFSKGTDSWGGCPEGYPQPPSTFPLDLCHRQWVWHMSEYLVSSWSFQELPPRLGMALCLSYTFWVDFNLESLVVLLRSQAQGWGSGQTKHHGFHSARRSLTVLRVGCPVILTLCVLWDLLPGQSYTRNLETQLYPHGAKPCALLSSCFWGFIPGMW